MKITDTFHQLSILVSIDRLLGRNSDTVRFSVDFGGDYCVDFAGDYSGDWSIGKVVEIMKDSD